MVNLSDPDGFLSKDIASKLCSGYSVAGTTITKHCAFPDDVAIYSRETVESMLEAHRKQVLLEKERSMSDWIPHKRGQCPVAKDAYVIVRWEGEECYGPNRADSWTWHTEDAPLEYMEVETVSKAHLERLRAEVASLKEERDEALRKLELPYKLATLDWQQVDCPVCGCEGAVGFNAQDFAAKQIESLTQQLAAAKEYAERLREAGQAVVDRWHSPNWKDGTHTADYINRLRDAIRKSEG